MLHVLLKVLRSSVVAIATVLCLTATGHAASPADMSLKVTGTSFKVGGLGRYTITVANRGGQPTNDAVHVVVALPAGLTLASQATGGWTCSANGQLVDCVTQRVFGVGKTNTFRLFVKVCDAAFPVVFPSFQVVYAGDPNAGNNIATRSTGIRPGQCVQGTVTPTSGSGSGTPTPTRTPLPGGTPTPTTVAGSPGAPVVTGFTCNGATQCTVATNQSFQLQLNFTDPNGNAISWSIMARRDDGFTTQVGHGNLGVPTASASIPLQFPGFTCSFSHCRQDMWTFSLTATDTTGLTSAPMSIAITVLGN